MSDLRDTTPAGNFHISPGRGDSPGKAPFEDFHYSRLSIDKAFVDGRAAATCSSFGWRSAIFHMLRLCFDFSKIRTLEIGCGTGTFSLTLNLLGAETTLLDADEQALAAAKKCFAVYGLKASYILGDVTKPLPENMRSAFDLVISGGLIEHFTGSSRAAVIGYHKLALNDHGIAYIAVPNALSPYYRTLRTVMELAGQWTIETEVPYTPRELLSSAAAAGFSRVELIGLTETGKDVTASGLALGSVALNTMPAALSGAIRRSKLFRKLKRSIVPAGAGLGMDLRKFVCEKAEEIKNSSGEYFVKKNLKDRLSSNIVLLGFMEGTDKSKAANTKISIVLPTHNSSKYLRQSIDSCLDQTYGNIELIIVDDASTDGTPALIASYKDKRITVLRHAKNEGLPAALNTGFKVSTGAYLTWTSDDNYYLPGALEKLVGHLRSSAGSDFVYSDYWGYYQDTGKKEYRILPELLNLRELNEVGPCFLYTRRVHDALGEYSKKYIYVEDYDYWIRIAKLFKTTHYPEPLYVYREHAGSLKATKRPLILFSDAMLKYHHGYSSLFSLGEATAYFFYSILVKPLARPGVTFEGSGRTLATAFTKIFSPPFTLTVSIIFAPLCYSAVKCRGYLLGSVKEITRFLFSRKSRLAALVSVPATRNILYINPTLVLGGTGRLMVNIVKSTRGNIFTFHTATTEPSENEFENRFKPYYKNILITLRWVKNQAICDYYLAKMIARLNIDIVAVSNAVEGYRFLSPLRSKHPSVRTFDIMHAEGSPGAWPEFAKYAPLLDARVCVSEHLKSYVLDQYAKNGVESKYRDRVVSIHNAVDAVRLDPAGYPRNIFKRKHGLPENSIIITYLGRFGVVKNPLLFVTIAKHILSGLRGRDIRFVMAGSGEEMERIVIALKKYAIEKYFTLTGVLDDGGITELLSDTFSLFITSVNEGIPFSAIEAMSMGIPVLSMDVGGMSELIKDGSNGFLIKQHEDIANVFLDRVGKMIGDVSYYARLSGQARTDILADFSFNSMGRKYEALFKELLAGREQENG